jgi:3-oxoacyl-[acyl-carrier protein] reductase
MAGCILARERPTVYHEYSLDLKELIMRQVVVTGGGTGIGLAVAGEFVRSGDHVTITGRREQVLKEAVAGLASLAGLAADEVAEPGALAERASRAERAPVEYACFDASDPGAVSSALELLPKRVDVLVNNAGGNTDFDREPVADGDLAALAEAWRANLDANLMSSVLVTAALTPRMAPDARIISFSSIAARRGAGSYGAAKAAVEAWTADVAAELGPRGITANVVSPGLTLGSEFFRGRLTDARRERLIAETRSGRAGTTADIAATVMFLASPAAGQITGQVIHVNGGAYLGR